MSETLAADFLDVEPSQNLSLATYGTLEKFILPVCAPVVFICQMGMTTIILIS